MGLSCSIEIINSFIGIFFAILFIQSGLDKIFNWKSELAFTKEHFSKTFLKPLVPLLFFKLTVLELLSGLLSAAGLVALWQHNYTVPLFGDFFCAGTIVCLFFGQRIAKDYGGAQALVAYFIVSLLGMFSLSY